jgi:hypothetical protein
MGVDFDVDEFLTWVVNQDGNQGAPGADVPEVMPAVEDQDLDQIAGAVGMHVCFIKI